MNEHSKINVINALAQLCEECHANAARHGFYDHDPHINIAEKIALMHSELSEALEAARCTPKLDEHCPAHQNFEVELADCCIRIFDLCGALQLNLGQALVDKIMYNESRPYKHGKQF